MSAYASLTPEQLSSLDSMTGVPPHRPCCKASTNMAQLVDNITAIVAKAPEGGGLFGLTDCFVKLLQNTNMPESEWSKYAYWSNELPYTRNLIATDNKNYTLLLLCWGAGYESRIHDHPCDGCFVKVLKNSIKESRYKLAADGDVVLYNEAVAGPGMVTHMHDSMGLHKISNPDPCAGAVTLHLYTPPYQTCKVWASAGSVVPVTGKMFVFSSYGLKSPTQPPAGEQDLSYYI